jgi:hypothetical protein
MALTQIAILGISLSRGYHQRSTNFFHTHFITLTRHIFQMHRETRSKKLGDTGGQQKPEGTKRKAEDEGGDQQKGKKSKVVRRRDLMDLDEQGRSNLKTQLKRMGNTLERVPITSLEPAAENIEDVLKSLKLGPEE